MSLYKGGTELNNYSNCTIGDRIREQRGKKGWSQDNLALDMNSSKSLISQYERGVTNPSLEKIELIADLLDTTPEYLQYGVTSVENRDKRLNQIIIWFESLRDESDKQCMHTQIEVLMEWILKKNA